MRRRQAVRYAFTVGVDRAVPAREISTGSWLVIGTETPVLDLRPVPARRPRPSLRERLILVALGLASLLAFAAMVAALLFALVVAAAALDLLPR